MFKNILSIIFLAAAIMIFFTWTQPLIEEINKLKDRVDIYDKNLGNLNELQNIRQEILSKYNAVNEEDFGRLSEMMPSQVNSMEVILEVEKIAKETGLSLKTIEAMAPEQDKTYTSTQKIAKEINSIPIIMKLSGPYTSFITFLSVMEKNLRLIDIAKISFVSGSIDLYEYNITATAYWQK
ncbi:type 4a pilus biogenesis protein PilO [Patescibacteria group bacterium]|nr:type 4a pilus biogenesis protein PilO [Patescibacteria group bacterium]